MARVNFWGVQGSCPGAYYEDNLGSNTSCISIEIDDTLIILDAGTGIRSLSATLDLNKYKKVILLLTHSHWDHIQGFPFFSYIYQKKQLIIYSHLKEHFDGLLSQINGINFPLKKEELMSEIIYTQDLKELEEQTGIHIETIQTNHQGECIGYRVKHKECDVCYIPDNQLHNTTITAFNDFVEFCANSRVLIHDSQYTDTDMPHKIDWGHSLYTDALELAIQSNVDHFVLFHHEPTRSKNEILKLVDHCKSITDKVQIHAGKEKEGIDLLGN